MLVGPGKRDFRGGDELQGPLWPLVFCPCFRAGAGHGPVAVASGREPGRVLAFGPVFLSCLKKGSCVADSACDTVKTRPLSNAEARGRQGWCPQRTWFCSVAVLAVPP